VLRILEDAFVNCAFYGRPPIECLLCVSLLSPIGDRVPRNGQQSTFSTGLLAGLVAFHPVNLLVRDRRD